MHRPNWQTLQRPPQCTKLKTGAHLATHCKSCNYKSRFSKTVILGSSKNKEAKELVEAHCIRLKGCACVSKTCAAVLNAQLRFFPEHMLARA